MIRAVKSFVLLVWWALLEMADYDRQPEKPRGDVLCVREVRFTPDLHNSLLVGFVVWDPLRPEVRGSAALTEPELMQLLQPFRDRGRPLDPEFFRTVLDAALQACKPGDMDTFGWSKVGMGAVQFGALRYTRNRPGRDCQQVADCLVDSWLRGP